PRIIVRRSASDVVYGRLRATAAGRPREPTATITQETVRQNENALQSAGETLRTITTRATKLSATRRSVETSTKRVPLVTLESPSRTTASESVATGFACGPRSPLDGKSVTFRRQVPNSGRRPLPGAGSCFAARSGAAVGRSVGEVTRTRREGCRAP